MDRRQLRTRDAVFKAFTELVSERPYGKITVQDIIDNANIGRSTFYSHFETKDHLLQALCEDLFGHVFTGVETVCPIPGFEPADGDYRDFMTHILYHFIDRREAFIQLIQSESSDLFIRYFKEQLQHRLAKCWLTDPNAGNVPNLPVDYLLNHFTTSFVETINWWIKNDMKQTPETITAYFAAVMDPILQTENTAPSIVPPLQKPPRRTRWERIRKRNEIENEE